MRKFWLNGLITFQILTGVAHTLGMFVETPPANETEKQLLNLTTNYYRDMGMGIHRSTYELVFAVSSCFSLLCFFGATSNIYLRKSVELKGFLGVQLIFFGTLFVIMFVYTFLSPTVLTGAILLFNIGAYLSYKKQS
jgi:hypothetical protein